MALTRDVEALAGRTFDVLVVGGGIHGLAIAYDAAQRGLAVALVERGDFGGAASFNHQKTAHGGLRSLQAGDLRRARESVAERRTLARVAPRLLRPLPFLIGTYRSVLRNRLALRAAFRIDLLIGRDRNHGVEPELQLPAPRLISRPAAERLFPGIRREGLTGGAMWYDYQIVEADRVTIGVALAAAACGATLANHVEALSPLRDGARIAGMRVRDSIERRDLDVRARLVINAAGAHAGAIMAGFGVRREFILLKAMNLVTTRPAGDLALAAPTRDGRMLTLTPWRGAALVGTSQSASFVTPEGDAPESGEVAAFVQDANEAFPALKLTRDAVTLVHRGIVPAETDRRGRPLLKRRAEILDHERQGVPGAMTVIGVKYTTARAVAARAVDVAARKFRHTGRSRTAQAILPGASIGDHEALAIETERRLRTPLAEGSRERIASLYGARCPAIIEIAARDRSLLQPLGPGTHAIGAEVVFAIVSEAARRLDDVIMRRTEIGAGGWPGDEIVARAAELGARQLGWTDARRAEEVARLRGLFTVP
ncbi:MAG TPA: FAD-dependent oxidoreductase [Vicinamibacterales bacterium]|nr:FAD-dependent oxidoreductase [Vicinamibacterales bacterium]